MLNAHYNSICTVSRLVSWVYSGTIPTTVAVSASFASSPYLQLFVGATPASLTVTLVGDVTEALSFDSDTRYARTTSQFTSLSSIYSDIGSTASTLEVQTVSYANDALPYSTTVETFHGLFMRRGQPVSQQGYGLVQRTDATVMKIGGLEIIEDDIIMIDSGTKYTVVLVEEIVDITRKRVWRLGLNKFNTESSRS